MMSIPPQHNTKHPPGQIVAPTVLPPNGEIGPPIGKPSESPPHLSAEKYRETTLGKGVYLRDVIERIQKNET